MDNGFLAASGIGPMSIVGLYLLAPLENNGLPAARTVVIIPSPSNIRRDEFAHFVLSERDLEFF
jgi:hypothetical protein